MALAMSEQAVMNFNLSSRTLRFIAVGIVASIFYLVTMSLMVDGLGQSTTAGAIASFVIGTLISYIGNTLWTWETRMSGAVFWRFLVVVSLGMLLNIVLAYVLEQQGVHHLLIGLIILVSIPIFNFVAHEFWTYRRTDSSATT